MAVSPNYCFSSTRNSSPYKRINRSSRGENLSLARTPKSFSMKRVLTKTKSNERKPENFKSVCDSINKRLLAADKQNYFEYFRQCKAAMQEIIDINSPVSEVMSQIKFGINQYIGYKDNEIKEYKNIKYLEKSLETKNDKRIFKEKCKTNSSFSIFNRLKKRSSSKKKLRFDAGLSLSSSNVPKLNINKIIIAKQESSDKITNTRDETVKNYLYQDYQDEFMAKYDEFSKSWRELIKEKITPGR